jgi:hypothetical protein
MATPITASDGLTYFAALAGVPATTICLQYRYNAPGASIAWYRSSYSAAATIGAVGSDLGPDSNLLGYVALNIPAGVTSGTVSIQYRATVATTATGNVAILGSNAAGTQNVILASTGQRTWPDTTSSNQLTTGSISLSGYTQIKIIYSRESIATGSGGMDLTQITVGP